MLCGFADESEKTYAAVVYVRSVSSPGEITIRLATAKTRVAPLKTISLSRLGLNAAFLLANLIKTVKESL